MSTDRRIDSKGRVTIPTDVRERLGLEPGETVTIDVRDGEIVVRPRVSRDAAVEQLKGCINEETRSAEATPDDVESLKDDWTSDLP